MLRNIKNGEEHLIANDPVRPHLPFDWRTRNGRSIYVLENDESGEIDAVICVAMMDEVPTCEDDMKWPGVDIAVFYTVWSYTKGSGRKIVFEAAKHIQKTSPYTKRFVTLSPLTDMAKNFHLRNGAIFLGKHRDCQNFEYILT
jgi:hypothetical protein